MDRIEALGAAIHQKMMAEERAKPMDDIEKLKERLRGDFIVDPKDATKAAQTITDLQAENADLREALKRCLAHEKQMAGYRGYSDCLCMTKSRDGEREYETDSCPHQLARKALGAKA